MINGAVLLLPMAWSAELLRRTTGVGDLKAEGGEGRESVTSADVLFSVEITAHL